MAGYSNSLGAMDLSDYYRDLERRVARLERGSMGAPSTDVTVINSLDITGLTLSSQQVVVFSDSYYVYMKFSWTAVPNDPSEYNKDALDGYLTSYSLDGVTYTAEYFTTDTAITIGPFSQSQVISFRVRARSQKGTLGDYSIVSNTTTADSTAPFQPSTPVVSPYLGQLAIDWNGLDVSSNPMPTDFKICEVHLSSSGPTFTPTTATLVGTLLRGGGTWIVTDLAYGTTFYSRLVAVDSVGNRSVASTAGSGVPVQAANGDISALNVGKLTAGTLSAVITISGRIATALTGVRAEMNSNGFQAFNSAGAQTFDVQASTGAVIITGHLRTAFPGAGSPYLEVTDSGDRTTIDMFNAAGTDSAFINSPQDGSGRPMIGINGGSIPWLSTTARPRLFFNSTSGIQLETVDLSPSQFPLGTALEMGSFSGQFAYFISGGVQTGGVFYVDQNLFIAARNGASTGNGGYVEGSLTQLSMSTQNTGTMSAELLLDDSEGWWLKGSFVSNGDTHAAVQCGTANVTGTPGGLVYSYGVTFVTRPQLVVTPQSGSALGDWRLSAFSTTGFTYTQVNGAPFNINWWGFRTQ